MKRIIFLMILFALVVFCSNQKFSSYEQLPTPEIVYIDDSCIGLEWEYNENISVYYLYRESYINNKLWLDIFETSMNYYDDCDLWPDTTYFYYLNGIYKDANIRTIQSKRIYINF